MPTSITTNPDKLPAPFLGDGGIYIDYNYMTTADRTYACVYVLGCARTAAGRRFDWTCVASGKLSDTTGTLFVSPSDLMQGVTNDLGSDDELGGPFYCYAKIFAAEVFLDEGAQKSYYAVNLSFALRISPSGVEIVTAGDIPDDLRLGVFVADKFNRLGDRLRTAAAYEARIAELEAQLAQSDTVSSSTTT